MTQKNAQIDAEEWAEGHFFWARFPDERDWRMNPTRLHVVAYVQDAQTGEILQAATVPVNDWMNGKRLVLP